MQVEASFPSGGQALEMVHEREGLLHDVAELAQSLDVGGALAGDHRQDPALAHFTAVGVAVVSLVAEHGVGSVPGTMIRHPMNSAGRPSMSPTESYRRATH
ncbi:hypothetical protein AVL59_05865 [Streptomyces griseochromogenes]|uniref:Uncharacterized protein n=1 Tax=Streptomyces griseochromogenes TaxID=68214 RepID=A0A1B1ARH3_9ACTN|nr:hypothetical protein AVL59_05865 [Streptomyces griseochromogenes]